MTTKNSLVMMTMTKSMINTLIWIIWLEIKNAETLKRLNCQELVQLKMRLMEVLSVVTFPPQRLQIMNLIQNMKCLGMLETKLKRFQMRTNPLYGFLSSKFALEWTYPKLFCPPLFQSRDPFLIKFPITIIMRTYYQCKSTTLDQQFKEEHLKSKALFNLCGREAVFKANYAWTQSVLGKPVSLKGSA